MKKLTFKTKQEPKGEREKKVAISESFLIRYRGSWKFLLLSLISK